MFRFRPANDHRVPGMILRRRLDTKIRATNNVGYHITPGFSFFRPNSISDRPDCVVCQIGYPKDRCLTILIWKKAFRLDQPLGFSEVFTREQKAAEQLVGLNRARETRL